MIRTEDNEYHTSCDNCSRCPKVLILVYGRDAGERSSEYSISECLALCSRCVRTLGKEMVNFKLPGKEA